MLAAILALALTAQTPTPPIHPPERPIRNVAIVIHEGVELLDFTGPAEVLDGPGFRVYTVAESGAPVHTHGAVTVVPDHTIADAPRPDILVIPGGDTPVLTGSPKMMEWIKSASAQTEITMSVCTGAFALSQIGALDGLKATTHWTAVGALRARSPKTEVLADQRLVDNGHIVTTAGVSAGIDGALHLLARLKGDEAAWQRARNMEYAWEPPLPPGAGPDAAAQRDALRHFVFREWAPAAAAYENVIADHPRDAAAHYRLGLSLEGLGRAEEGLAHIQRSSELGRSDAATLAQLGRAQLVAKKYPEAIASYRRALDAGIEDHGTSFYNLACACALGGQPDEAFDALNKAVDAGFRNRALLERDDDLAPLRADARFKAIIARL